MSKLQQLAVSEAQRTMPDFINFIIDPSYSPYIETPRVRMLANDRFIWVEVTDYNKTENTVSGSIIDNPNSEDDDEEFYGEQLTLSLDQIFDWAFDYDDEQYGNFTVYAAAEDANKSEEVKRNYFNYYNLLNNPLDNVGQSFDEIVEYVISDIKANYGQIPHSFANVSENNLDPSVNTEPINNISLRDYAAIAFKLSAGVELQLILETLNLSHEKWEEANIAWQQRMADDESFTITLLYGQYFAEADQHPTLSQLQAEVSELGIENLNKLKTDREFYATLEGIRAGAYECGIDGAEYIKTHYGISLGDFQQTAMMYAEQDRMNNNLREAARCGDIIAKAQEEFIQNYSEE